MSQNSVTMDEYNERIARLNILNKLMCSEDEDERVAAAREVLQLTDDLQDITIEVTYE